MSLGAIQRIVTWWTLDTGKQNKEDHGEDLEKLRKTINVKYEFEHLTRNGGERQSLVWTTLSTTISRGILPTNIFM